MKKLLLTIGLALLVVNIFAQLQPIELSGVKLDSVQVASGIWITEISRDGTFSDSSIHAIPTEAAVKRYADSVASVVALDSIARHTDSLQLHNLRININTVSIVSKQDSINKHTDTLQVHNTRLKALESSETVASLSDSIAAHTDTLQSHITKIKVNTNGLADVLDSLMAHTDTLQLHMTKINALYDSVANGVGGAATTLTAEYDRDADSLLTVFKRGSQYFIGFTTSITGSGLFTDESGSGDTIMKVQLSGITNYVETSFVDSIYTLKYSAKTRYAYYYMDSTTHAMKIDSTILGAGYGLKMKLLNFRRLIRNQVNGEIAWPLSETESTHRPDTLLMNARENTQTAMIEQLVRKTVQLETIIYCLIGFVLVMTCVILYKKK